MAFANFNQVVEQAKAAKLAYVDEKGRRVVIESSEDFIEAYLLNAERLADVMYGMQRMEKNGDLGRRLKASGVPAKQAPSKRVVAQGLKALPEVHHLIEGGQVWLSFDPTVKISGRFGAV